METHLTFTARRERLADAASQLYEMAQALSGFAAVLAEEAQLMAAAEERFAKRTASRQPAKAAKAKASR